MQAEMMMPEAQQGGMPPNQPTQDNQEQGSPKAVIEVTIAQDGSITVELESGEQETTEGDNEAQGEASGSQPVQVKDISEACQVIEKMYASVTQNPAVAKADQQSGYSSQ